MAAGGLLIAGLIAHVRYSAGVHLQLADAVNGPGWRWLLSGGALVLTAAAGTLFLPAPARTDTGRRRRRSARRS
jgi:hypothetical protein